MKDQMNLERFGISASVQKTDQTSAKNLAKSLRKINDHLAAIADDEDQEEKELKEIKQEIQEKCQKLLARQKQIKQDRKKRAEERMLYLGERRAYMKELKALGFDIKGQDVAMIPQNASRKVEVLDQVEA
jgi:septal ring factor EnvC (AmiA/AmiB activator)